ncbi:dTDP-4-dehydrorhamnose reductase [Clostridium formicaceticum]|uniref:dTDP-4-dehydrorhamnose reductase n=1 Tax=Clostridium formicaceticum TaxID=1497 RepID=A0AAC9WH92_9CLOT|nr:dTDP-4-dehydrorhamnose reductase [Clostridium formicaceticum]AOY76980.1 dTDP-4-dehydrorhamnose reductase [Clostridium formicaceticum]ARE87465.1 dTDP-4-dehydrorhamnose reductase [Clostridium formicaceticum]
MTICILGGTGQLGHELIKVMKDKKVASLGRKNIDITKLDEVYKTLKTIKPDVIIHAAAFTDVDQCENKPELAFKVNTQGTKNVSIVAGNLGSKLIYISTDYVFDGNKGSPYNESDLPNPINIYGMSKYEGEIEVQKNLEKYFIVRTAWLYGNKGKNFVKTILSLTSNNTLLKVVDDQIGSPTYAVDLAQALKKLLVMEDYGVYHFINAGNSTWYDFAKEIIKIKNIAAKLSPITSTEIQRKAQRPANSTLNNNSSIKLRPWQEALKEYLLDK